ncbi:RNA-directed DNA polymerase, eukaryota, reverse transcriptase zinc-binding domain protein [Tanacetum coccineum]
MSWQATLCVMETPNKQSRFFCSFIYAANHGKERRELWNDLNIQKKFSNGFPWVLLRDFNVTLFPNEHSTGGSNITQDMQDFIDYVNNAEIEDLCSSGIMINEKFIESFQKAHATFLLYIISDHSPAVLSIPGGISKQVKPFRFANHIVDKEYFINIVEAGWNASVNGIKMFQVTKKLKKLKRPLKRLNWQNGNVFKKVILLEDELKKWQSKINLDPYNHEVKKEGVSILTQYKKAKADESKLLMQKIKLD